MQLFRLIKAPLIYLSAIIASLLLALSISLCSYSLRIKVPVNNIQSVIIHPEEKVLTSKEDIIEFVNLVYNAKYVVSIKDYRWVTTEIVEVHYTNNDVIFFGPHTIRKIDGRTAKTTITKVYELDFDFTTLESLANK